MTEWVRTVWFEDGQQCECSVPKDWIQNQIVNLPGGVKILDERKTTNDNNLNFRPHSVSNDSEEQQGYNSHTSNSYSSVPPSLQRHSAAHLMHNPTQTNMQMPDPRLHHNMQNTDPRQTHPIQSLDPRSTNNIQNNRPDNTLQSLDPRLTVLNNTQTGASNDQRDQQIGQKRDRSSDMVSMVPPNKLTISEKMISNQQEVKIAHCTTCNCHVNNDSFPMREQDFQRTVVNVLLDMKQEIRKLARGPVDLPDMRIEPADDFVDFIRLEESLKDPDTYNTFKFQLAKIGGIDTMDCTKRIMIVLMTNKLMSEFNMEGKGNKKKRPFKNTKALELITGAIHLQIKTTDKLVYDAVKDLLRRAPDRKGGAGRTEHLSESPSFIVAASTTPTQPTQQVASISQPPQQSSQPSQQHQQPHQNPSTNNIQPPS